MFASWYKLAEGWGYVQPGWAELDEATRARFAPHLVRIAGLERRIIEELGGVLQAGPSEE